MTRATRGEDEYRPLGGRTDRLLAAYALLAGVALAFPHRPRSWMILAVLHVAAVVIGLGAGLAQRAWRAASRRIPRFTANLHDGYPLLLIPLLYAELPLLNRAVHHGVYFDTLVQGWEQAVFGSQLSRTLAQALPNLVLSEFLHFSYLSYYLLILLPPVLLALDGRRSDFRAGVFALMLTFVAHYLFFVWFPVQGPRYLFPAPGGPMAEGPVYRLTRVLLEAGSSQGSAFPSSHVGVAVTQTLVTWRYLRPWRVPVAVLAVGLTFGAVYAGFHYAIDALAGAVLGGLCATVALRSGERGEAHPAPAAAHVAVTR